MSSIPFVCFNTTQEVLKEMAREGVFAAVGDDNAKKMDESSVIGRYGQNDPGFGGSTGRERQIELPGFIVTYLGMAGGISQGSLCHDQRVARILVQLVDSTDEGSDTRAETYFRWMTDVREWLQENPYNSLDQLLGQVSLVHVSDESVPEQDKWAIDREMRMHAIVNCVVHMRRTKDQQLWQST